MARICAHAAFACLVLAAWAGAARAQDPERQDPGRQDAIKAPSIQDAFVPLGLSYCPPPVRPSCIDVSKTYDDPSALAACQRDTTRYEQSVFDYRQCLNTEMERAVRQVNESLYRFRCRSGKQKNCP